MWCYGNNIQVIIVPIETQQHQQTQRTRKKDAIKVNMKFISVKSVTHTSQNCIKSKRNNKQIYRLLIKKMIVKAKMYFLY